MISLTEETGEFAHLSKAQNALDRMDELKADLLSPAKEGKIVDEETDVAAAEIADRARTTSETAAASLSVAADLGVISADPSRLQTLLENLFGNAVEHGGSEVTVRVGKLPTGFFIADDGPGVPAEQRNDFFDDASLRFHDREGLGLVIVQQIVEAHDWTIRVTESQSGGARFEITGVSFLD